MAASLLSQVLEQSKCIHALLEQSADALSLIDTGVTRAPADLRRLLQEASTGLTAVNRTLEIEIRGRKMVDHQLAAAIEQEEGARNAALHDHLTGLPNRLLFKDRVDHGIAQAKRHGWILAVMFVDLDNFKGINDTYGHEAGDVVLQTVANRLAHNARTDDTVSRYGGDEFLYLLAPLQEQKDIAMIAAKTLEAIRSPCEVRVGDVTVNLCLGASIGISLFPRDGATAAELIKRADDAMYGAKETKPAIAFAE